MSTRSVTLRLGAQNEPRKVEVDGRAAAEIRSATTSGQRISGPEMQRRIIPAIADGGGRVAASERPLLEILDAACDDRRKVLFDGARLRMTAPAKKAWSAYRAGLEAALPPERLSEPRFQKRVSDTLRSWYDEELTRRIADIVANDPERASAYDDAQRAADRAFTQKPEAFTWDASAFGVRYDQHIGAHWLEGRADTAFPYRDARGQPIALADVAFVQLDYDPAYAGQQLTSWFAFDRRTGQLLEHFDTQA